MSRVFVTGGYGLLGTWLVRALLDRGDTVVVLRRDDGRNEREAERDELESVARTHGLSPWWDGW